MHLSISRSIYLSLPYLLFSTPEFVSLIFSSSIPRANASPILISLTHALRTLNLSFSHPLIQPSRLSRTTGAPVHLE